jgi:hypothetical protein
MAMQQRTRKKVSPNVKTFSTKVLSLERHMDLNAVKSLQSVFYENRYSIDYIRFGYCIAHPHMIPA